MDDAQDRDDTGDDHLVPSQAVKPVAVHALEAADYSLGPLDFATPALGQVHALAAASYSLGPLAFTAPVVLRYFVRIVQNQGGRPRKIPADILSDMIAKMEKGLVEIRATTSRRVGREDCAVLRYARSLADAAGVAPSDAILLRQVIRPAFRNDDERRRRKFDRN
jgi:hypothetical protein